MDLKQRFLAIFAGAALILVGLANPAVFSPALAAEPVLDHVQIRMPDPQKGAAWYVKYFGGTVDKTGAAVDYGKISLRFAKLDNPKPSVGSAIDHIGFTVPDVEAKLGQFKADGVKIVSPAAMGMVFKIAYVEDPWGSKIELVEDQVSGFHHVHLRGPDNMAILKWMHENFGGKAGKLRDKIDGVEQRGVWLLGAKSDAPVDFTFDHVLDHLGYNVTDADAMLKAFKAKGLEAEPLQKTPDGILYTYIKSPAGVRIELVQRP
jgi:catechol 2,3-dioxygenase-like lactoylglutathione lyase family enzyme